MDKYTYTFYSKTLNKKIKVIFYKDYKHIKTTKLYTNTIIVAGIYAITNKVTNKIYIGKSNISIISRLQNHISALTNNKHVNKELQNDYNKYGINNFQFSILEFFNKNEITNHQIKQLENYYINLFNYNSYNIQ